MRLQRKRCQGGDAAEAAAMAFIEAVGMRVRRLRQAQRLSRRALANLSGVSQRYLAQLEGGDGNISIALLHKVAAALCCDVAQLVADGGPAESEDALLYRLCRAANGERRRQALALLHRQDHARPQRVCLIGLRGAGKSTLGRLLGQSLRLPFVELNADVEEQSGMAVEEVMALYGQEGYRRLERQALDHVIARHDGVVLAAAGGIVSDEETFQLLLREFHTIWLKATPREHMNRVRAQSDERPMAGNPRAMDELNAILAARERLYARADVVVDTSEKSVETVLRDLLALIPATG